MFLGIPWILASSMLDWLALCQPYFSYWSFRISLRSFRDVFLGTRHFHFWWFGSSSSNQTQPIWFPWYSILLSVGVINTMTKKQPGEERMYFNFCSLQSIILQKSNNGKKPGAEAEAEAQRNTVYWFAPHALLNQLSYTIQGHLPRHGTFHSGQSPPTWVINYENAHKLAHRPICWKQVLQLTFPLPRWL